MALLDIETSVRKLANIDRRTRRGLMASIDWMLLALIAWALTSARYGKLFVPDDLATLVMLLAAPTLTVLVMLAFRVYHIVARYLGPFGALKLGGCVAIGATMWATAMLFLGQHDVPRSVVIGYIPIATLAVVGTRVLAASLFKSIGIVIGRANYRGEPRIPVLVYGTGPLAVQLVQSLGRSATHEVVGFIDQGKSLAGRSIERHTVYRLEKLGNVKKRFRVEEIYIAVEKQSPSERKELLNHLESSGLRVRIIPDMVAVATGRATHELARGVRGRDLLGRDEVAPDKKLLAAAAEGKRVLVTGAGGSIGSEIALQLMALKPAALILMDHSEAALYQIEKSVRGSLGHAGWMPEISTVLGSVLDDRLVGQVISMHQVDTVFHAAAFKHVPIIEQHPLAGVENNILGTETLVRHCIESGVERFVLVSTDKAVRPTNVMGATKRIAELIVQARAAETKRTILSAVRFGNVLESSGSVVGLFREQINAGGPVTVTDPNVVRYFMSLEEAANLVIQAAGMAKGGEVFVLDMGSPVRIIDLAKSMIRLMGLQVRTPENPAGQIEIKYTGLRPGEKLVEELLISEDSALGTDHPRIWKSKEPGPQRAALERDLVALRGAVEVRDVGLAIEALRRSVEGYAPSAEVEFTFDPPPAKYAVH